MSNISTSSANVKKTALDKGTNYLLRTIPTRAKKKETKIKKIKAIQINFSYFFHPGSKFQEFSTSDSDSSSKTVYFASWTCPESQNLVKQWRKISQINKTT